MKAKVQKVVQKSETGARAVLRGQGYLPVSEAAQRAGYTPQALYKWIGDGHVQGRVVAGRRWVLWASVLAYLNPPAAAGAR